MHIMLLESEIGLLYLLKCVRFERMKRIVQEGVIPRLSRDLHTQRKQKMLLVRIKIRYVCTTLYSTP